MYCSLEGGICVASLEKYNGKKLEFFISMRREGEKERKREKDRENERERKRLCVCVKSQFPQLYLSCFKTYCLCMNVWLSCMSLHHVHAVLVDTRRGRHNPWNRCL